MKKGLVIVLLLCLLPVAVLADTIRPIPVDLVDEAAEQIHVDSSLLLDEGKIHISSLMWASGEKSLYDSNNQFIKGRTYEDYNVSCYELNENNELVPCQGKCVSLYGEPEIREDEFGKETHYPGYISSSKITPQHHTYLYENGIAGEGFDWSTLRFVRWNPSADGAWDSKIEIPLEQFGVEVYDEPNSQGFEATPYTFLMDDTTLYIAVDHSEGVFKKYIMYAYDLASGTFKEVYKTNFAVSSLYFADNNQLLVSMGSKFEFVDLETGAVRKTDRRGYPDVPLSLIPDGKGCFYLLGSSGLYQLDEDLNETLIYQLPAGMQAKANLIYRPENHDFVFLATNKDTDTCSLFIIDEDRSRQDNLILIDFSDDLGAMTRHAPPMEEFHTAHSECTVVGSETITDYDQLNQALVLGGDNFDVMLLDANLINLPNLYQKGYFADLSDMEAIRAYVDAAYPVFREASMIDSRIAALPLIASDNVMMVNEPLWKELGLPIPTTYGELLDTIAHCLEEGVLNEYPLFQSDRFELDSRGMPISLSLMAPTESYSTLWYHLLRSYIGTTMQEGELTFQDDTIVALMDKLHGMKDKLDEHDARRAVGEALLYPYGQLTYVSGRRLYDQEAFRPLLLGVHDAEDIAVPVRLKVMLINPRSPRVDLAKEYLAYFAAHPTSTTRCVITTEQPDGIEKRSLDTSRESDAARIADYEARIEAARTEGDLLTVRDLEEELAQFKENRSFNWDVTPEAAQTYYQITPYMVVMDNENFGFVEENGSRDIAAFDEGRIDAKTLCQRLEQLLQMRRLENQ